MNEDKIKVSGKRPKKRRFQGNKYLKKTGSNNKKNVFDLKERKISSMGKKLSSPNVSLKDNIEKVSSNFTGYRLFDLNLLLTSICSKLSCSFCHGNIQIIEFSNHGLSSHFHVNCDSCGTIQKFHSCERIGQKKNIPEVNRRSVLAMRCIGQGLTSLQTFCTLMSLPNPVDQKSYNKINKNIALATKAVAQEIVQKAGLEERSLTAAEGITVSGDGTWKTRGHTSVVGACSVIGAESGKVLDYEVMSTFCKVCSSYRGPKFGPKYAQFFLRHKAVCKKNHCGSSGKMEVDGMLKIFKRSESLHQVKYLEYIGDGDTKTFSTLSESLPYEADHPLKKLECVGHIQKRMGTRLRKLKSNLGKKKLSDGKSIGGKGRLTDAIISKITSYYGNAIRSNSASVPDMRTAIWAVWGHTFSTDKEPLHVFCPQGPSTWCKYTAAVKGKTLYKHKNVIPTAVRDEVKPIFAELSHPKLLRKCLGGKTQNTNESWNSLLWTYCPKVIGCGREVVEIGANLATSVFNEGTQIYVSVLERCELSISKKICLDVKERDNLRIKTAEKRALASSYQARKAKRMKKLQENEVILQKEGISYSPGAF